MSRSRRDRGSAGFTLLEVLVAVAILSVSLTSLLSSQIESYRATRYARSVTAASFLAEHQLLEIEWLMLRDGWVTEDKLFDGDFSEEGWGDMTYDCVVDFIELPEYSELVQAKDAADTGGLGPEVYDAEEQAFDTLGLVWPIVKAAIEQSIRKASCTVHWKDGNIEHDFTVATFWTDAEKLKQLPQMGGEATDDDPGGDDGGGQDPAGGSGPGGAGPSGGGIGGAGPAMPPSQRGKN